MLICDDIKLDYSNVLIRPKRSTITSRFDVYMKRTYKFVHSKNEWTGIPIMASNMDTVGTPEMYQSLKNYNMLTCFHKFMDINNYPPNERNRYAISIGIRDEDYDKLKKLYESYPERCNIVCVDVANGYMDKLVDFCKSVGN